MQERKNARMVTMTVDQIKENCLFFEENRCHYLNYDEAANHYFNKFDVDKTKSRVKSYKDNIFAKQGEWAEVCAMKVDVVDGKNYVIDGQGRFIALLEYNKNADATITDVPVDMYFNKTHDEMVNDTMMINTFQRNWSATDMFRAYLILNGRNDEANELLELMTKYSNELDVKQYTSSLILLGYGKASHRNKIDKNTKLSKYHKVIFDSFKSFYDITVESCDGNQTQIKAIKKQDAAQAFYRVLSSIIRTCENEQVAYESRLSKVSEILGKYIARLDRKHAFSQAMGGRQQSIYEYFRDEIKRKTKDQYIKQSLGIGINSRKAA